MKLLIPLAIIALCVYYYLETHKEEAPAAPVAAAAPTATPKKKFYHSPLDAPAMPTGTGVHSGSGYMSSSRNTNWQGSHLEDGRAARSSRPDPTPDPDND